jgi:hypothetical protein
MSYDDNRVGMMRSHIAQQRAAALCDYYPRDVLRAMARKKGLPAGQSHKIDLALELAYSGTIAPDYDIEKEE